MKKNRLEICFIFLTLLSFNRLAKADPAEDHLQKGHSFAYQNNEEAALKEYEAALKIKPDYLPALSSLESMQAKIAISHWRSQNVPVKCQVHSNDLDVTKTCAEQAFTVNGSPIHPKMIEDLSSLLSDRPEQITSISLLGAQGSNRYCCEDKIKINGTSFTVEDSSGGFFSYSVLGKSAKGVVVLHTISSGGGTGRFHSLLLLSFQTDEGLDLVNAKLIPRKRLLMVQRGEFPLGDRQGSVYSLKGDEVLRDGKLFFKL